MLSRYTYFRSKGSGGFRSIFSDKSQPTLYFRDALLHNPHDTSSPQYITPPYITPTIHHPHDTSSPPYITPTIHHPHHTSHPTMHHPHHTSSPPYIIPTIHNPHHTSSPPYIIPTIHHTHHTYSLSYIIPNQTPYFSTVPVNVHHEAWSGISREHPQWESDVWPCVRPVLRHTTPEQVSVSTRWRYAVERQQLSYIYYIIITIFIHITLLDHVS